MTRLPRRARRRIASGGTLLLTAVLLAGCQSEIIARGVSRPMPATPRDAPPVPEGAVVNRIVFMVGSKPLDTDGNGFPDRIDTTVTLFAYPHPTPLWSEGRLVYSVFIKGDARLDDATPIVEWSFEGDELEQARAVSQVGRQYRASLSLYMTGSDRLPFSEVDVVCRFEPADGGPAVHCTGVRTLQIGRRTPG